MYGIEKYTNDAKKAGLTAQLKADKFDEIRDAARDLAKAETVLKELLKVYPIDPDEQARRALDEAVKDVNDYRFVLDRFISRAAEGGL